jgi:signal transduction histidine kinase
MTRWQMLPGGLLEEPGAKRTLRDWIVDLTMYAVALVISFIAVADSAHEHTDGLWLADLLGGLVAFVALWWRRSHPVAVAAITIAVAPFSAFASGPGAAALFNLAIRGSRRALVIMVALGLTTSTLYVFVYPDDSVSLGLQFAFGLLITVVVLGWGLFARTQRDLLRSSHERAQQLEAEQRAHVEQAREAERRRIAGEMHDVLAHRLSLLSVHAGALEFHPDAPPEEIAEAAGVIRATAHDALRDLREVIGVLRTGDGGINPPQPTLAELPALIDESRAAGMNVNARIEASGGEARLARTAYRVVQEGLTNARKHAPEAAVEVTVKGGDDLLVLVVSRRSAAHANGTPGTGTGLIGLSERVALMGGRLEHGPNARGDFVLRATLPWT